MYIIFEGIVAAGKTTHSKKLYDYLKEKFPEKEVVWTREPGSTEVAKSIRKLVQATKFNEEMNGICEAYLYAASRAQSLTQVVKPVLANDGIVISDRSFITSMAFQGFGRGIGHKIIYEINKVGVDNCIPDLIVFLDFDINNALQRVSNRDGDKFERLGKDFFEKVRKGYLEISKMDMFKSKWVSVRIPKRLGKSRPVEENFKLILDHIKPYIDSIE